jgi:hypothetical protein
MQREQLERILRQRQGQPAGEGYTDVIVCPDDVLLFLYEVRGAGFSIKGVSWWEYCENGISEARFGMGGPASYFYEGDFAEIPIRNIDPFEASETVDDIHSRIAAREFRNNEGESLTYASGRLWPGFWIETPDDWKSNDRLLKKYGMLFKEITAVVNAWDPIGLIGCGAPPNEYDIEISDFLPRLMAGEKDAVHKAFQAYFGDTFRATESESAVIEKKILGLIRRTV